MITSKLDNSCGTALTRRIFLGYFYQPEWVRCYEDRDTDEVWSVWQTPGEAAPAGNRLDGYDCPQYINALRRWLASVLTGLNRVRCA